MDSAAVARELASGGAYTAWFVVVVLAGVVVYLFREVMKLNRDLISSYKENDNEVLENQDKIIRVLNEHTSILSTLLGLSRGRV